MLNFIEFIQTGDEVYKEYLKKVCAKYDISYMELTIILFLGNNPKLDKASDIVSKRHIAKSHVSATVSSLIKKGLIKGEYTDKDHKSIHLKLTDEALIILKDGQKAQKEYLSIYTSDLSDDEKIFLKSILNRMEHNLLEKKKEIKNGR